MNFLRQLFAATSISCPNLPKMTIEAFDRKDSVDHIAKKRSLACVNRSAISGIEIPARMHETKLGRQRRLDQSESMARDLVSTIQGTIGSQTPLPQGSLEISFEAGRPESDPARTISSGDSPNHRVQRHTAKP